MFTTTQHHLNLLNPHRDQIADWHMQLMDYLHQSQQRQAEWTETAQQYWWYFWMRHRTWRGDRYFAAFLAEWMAESCGFSVAECHSAYQALIDRIDPIENHPAEDFCTYLVVEFLTCDSRGAAVYDLGLTPHRTDFFQHTLTHHLGPSHPPAAEDQRTGDNDRLSRHLKEVVDNLSSHLRHPGVEALRLTIHLSDLALDQAHGLHRYLMEFLNLPQLTTKEAVSQLAKALETTTGPAEKVFKQVASAGFIQPASRGKGRPVQPTPMAAEWTKIAAAKAYWSLPPSQRQPLNNLPPSWQSAICSRVPADEAKQVISDLKAWSKETHGRAWVLLIHSLAKHCDHNSLLAAMEPILLRPELPRLQRARLMALGALPQASSLPAVMASLEAANLTPQLRRGVQQARSQLRDSLP